MSKNSIFYLLLLGILISIVYLLIGFYSLSDYKKYKKYLFNNIEDLEFHYKYSDKINHLRAKSIDNSSTGYLFNKIKKSNSKNKILFLGDSWFDQINLGDYKNSLNDLEIFSSKNNLELINGGITSFSPSLMHVQFKILNEDFNIIPKIIVIHIDQTDIGDEICRYKERKVYDEKGNLIAVKRFNYDKEVFNGLKIYKYSEIKFRNSNLLNFFRLSNFTIKYFFEKNIFRLKKIYIHGWRTGDQRNYYKCRFKVIKSFLNKKNQDANNYFSQSLINFLNHLNANKEIEKIFITSFPHRGHVEKIYENNVSKLIDNVLNNYSDKFEHLFTDEDYFDKLNLDEVYIVGDEASHLTPKYHQKLFIKKIIKKLNEEINS